MVSDVTAGDILNVSALIYNIGGVYANNANISFYVDSVYRNSTILNLTGVYEINETNGAKVNFTWTAVLGKHNLTVTADPGNLINETNETNNEMSADITVYHVCDLNRDGIYANDYNDLIAGYKCFLEIETNCTKISFQDWTDMKEEYLCFVGLK